MSASKGLYVTHVMDYVIKPTLSAMGMGGQAAEELMLGTAIAESRLRYLHQLGNGPAVGLWQMEPSTAKDIVHRYLNRRKSLEERFEAGFSIVNAADIDWDTVSVERLSLKLITDLRFSCALARLKYLMIPHVLPQAGDIVGQGSYYKRWYNTSLGKGDASKYVSLYQEWVK